MEITKPEVAAILATIAHVEDPVKELIELELAMIGGGVGEVVLA
jgi:hypothetical protein